MSLTLSFDIGYASIGWCVLSAKTPVPAFPEILGTGVVTFPTDDCLASTRRDLRRTRRHVRSTRQRIERLKLWLLHRGVLTRNELDRPGHPAPFLLAAAALQGHRTLDAWELWTVLRWYAHNRGYDGNSRWANGEENTEDTEKEQAAIELMQKAPVTKTMCETVCKCLELNPAESGKRISSALPYKTLNAAYPRKTVTAEVGELLSKHIGKIPSLDAETVRLILKSSELTADERAKLSETGIKLTKRYSGGLLFGQLVPRFDNRIISRCPVTWAKTHDEALAAGKAEAEARKLADKFAKVPAARCVEFLEFRFASIIANLRANGQPLARDLRRHLFQLAKERGSLTANELEKEIHRDLGKVPTNIDAYFKVHPDSEKALVIDPAAKLLRTNQLLKPLLPLLSDAVKEKALRHWQRNRSVRLGDLLTWTGESGLSIAPLEAALAELHAKDRQKGKRKDWDFPRFLTATLAPEDLSGRAPYARPVLRRVVEEVLAGPFDPRKANKANDPEKGDEKPENGVLYDLGIPTSRVRHLQNERPLEQLTNNHLVRHRMLILDRLLDDLGAEFVTPGNEVSRVVVEVARELAQFSGMTAKKISIELNSRLKDFKSSVDHLAKHAPDLTVNGGIIRKCRIAMDLGWCCPFTGETYDAYDLPKLEREHIIPYATRNTNALHALVLTWPEINRMKGKRTARQFITDDGSKTIPGKANLSLFTLGGFDAFVEKLKVTGHDDDRRRQKARKALLATTDFEDKELGFTDGALTKTSHLMKLAMRGLALRFPAALCDPIPGSVTGEIRKAWKILGTLSLACPEIIDPETGEPRPKDEIRGLTHMHHALDAATIALATHYFPLQSRGNDQKGKIWQALLRRQRSPEEKEFLYKLGIFDRYQRTRRDKQGKEYQENDVRLQDLPKELKEHLRQSLAQCRVAQHLPSDRSGAKAELTTWGVLSTEGEGEDARVKLQQRTSTVENGLRKITVKSREERSGKLLGNTPKNGIGKLQSIKGAMIIGENYGLALDPAPSVIPFHDVTARLNAHKDANGGKPVRVLRNGMLIRLIKSPARSRQDYSGIWKITSIKNNKGTFLIDMIRPGYITSQNGVAWSGMNKTLGPLLDCGLDILPRLYSGHTNTD
jgi:hypothetical protein